MEKQAKDYPQHSLGQLCKLLPAKEEMPSLEQVQQLSGAQGEEAIVGSFILLGPSSCYVQRNGYSDLANASRVWAVVSRQLIGPFPRVEKHLSGLFDHPSLRKASSSLEEIKLSFVYL